MRSRSYRRRKPLIRAAGALAWKLHWSKAWYAERVPERSD
jgi:hypothetical protein